ncbi:beta strand repeat-containing protein [Flexivirga alba]|uniref:Beta strand repeat-containing protein n=1 Tax=Flexivirga alba TaxID=702742 RepID=A0ABW2ADX8_9MICO
MYDKNGNWVANSYTDSAGAYTMKPLPAGSYTVCFDASYAYGGTSTTGYASQCYAGVPWTSGNNPPAGTTAVAVTSGSIHSGVNATLSAAGGISGTVTDAAGGADLTDVTVNVYDGSGNAVSSASTDGAGTYTAGGIPAGSYTVCFTPASDSGGSSATGYVPQCYKNVPWDGSSSDLPSGTTPVSATTGTTHSGIDAALGSAAGISGRVTAATGGAALGNATVAVFTRGKSLVTTASTDSSGSYTVGGLQSGSYYVCFDAAGAAGGPSTAGYVDQCFNGVVWDGAYDPESMPSGMTAVSTTTGTVTAGVSAALTSDAAITGTVTAASDGSPVSEVWVYAYDSSGNQLTQTTTGGDGTYTLSGLAAGTDTVCFDPSQATGETASTAFVAQCYNDVAWAAGANPPSDASPVSVITGAVASGINAPLKSVTASIKGLITDSSGGGVKGAQAYIYDGSGYQVANVTTSVTGAYSVPTLPAGSYTVCFDARDATGSSATGYLSQCYKAVPWSNPSSGALPAGTTAVAVTSGAVQTVNATLAPAGAIAGTTTAATGGGGVVSGVTVTVYDGNGDWLQNTYTDPDGTYSITGLATGTYTVCFDTSYASGGSSKTGYLSQCYNDPSGTGTSTPPVSVTSGATTGGIDAALAPAGAIAGTVTDTSGHGVSGATVYVYDQSGNRLYEATTTTGLNGTYAATGLTTGSYTVCFDASGASGGSSVTGYLSQCYKDVSWDGSSTLPSGTTSVPVTAGSTKSGVNASLTAGAAISGTVIGSVGGAALSDVGIHVFDSTKTEVAYASTGSTGAYTVRGLPTGTYTVCFNGSAGTGAGSTGGFLDECYKNLTWYGSRSSLPAGTTPVSATAGSATSGINATLPLAAGISGTVTAGGNAVAGVTAEVFDSSGTYLTSATTDASGDYTLTGLSAGSDTVCFQASQATGAPATGYLSQCYKGIAWDGSSAPPSGTTSVTASTGSTQRNINASLTTAAGISGTVTAAADSGALADVTVDVYGSGSTLIGQATTDSSGAYTVGGLSAGSETVCFDASGASGSSTTGYQSQCYNGVAWDGSATLPTGTTSVTTTDGTTKSGIDAKLAAG